MSKKNNEAVTFTLLPVEPDAQSTPPAEDFFNQAVTEIYEHYGQIGDWLHMARRANIITQEEYNLHNQHLIQVLEIFIPKSRFGKEK
jgi:hypothetical protein